MNTGTNSKKQEPETEKILLFYPPYRLSAHKNPEFLSLIIFHIKDLGDISAILIENQGDLSVQAPA
jgi:hypothetical protein